MDNIRIDAMQQINQTTETKQAQVSDEDFKFTLMSKIEEDGLAERLDGMMKEIVQQGKKLFIICDDLEGEALATIIVNKLKGIYRTICRCRFTACKQEKE